MNTSTSPDLGDIMNTSTSPDLFFLRYHGSCYIYFRFGLQVFYVSDVSFLTTEPYFCYSPSVDEAVIFTPSLISHLMPYLV